MHTTVMAPSICTSSSSSRAAAGRPQQQRRTHGSGVAPAVQRSSCSVQVSTTTPVCSTSCSTLPVRRSRWSLFGGHGASRQQRRVAAAASSAEDPARSLKETAALDELIEKLLTAKSEQELARLVAENIFSIDSKFWLRVATRNDTAASKDEQARLKSMADKVMVLVDTVMRRTEQQLADSSRVLQEILSAAADEQGEWYLPLTPEQVASLRKALDKNSDRLDEALLSNAFAWIRKCSEDRFDTMVQLIQKVLQLYAAKQLRGEESTGVEGAINQVVWAEEPEWGPLIRRLASEGSVSELQFMEALQRRMEATVLGLQSGSYAQRVQAEYLKEIEARARSVFKELAQTKA